MKELTLLYTNIQHNLRRDLDISCLEYVLVDMIYHLSTKPDSAVIGWCYKSKEQLALEIGITKQGLLKMIDRLILCGLLVKNAETRYLKTTEKYFGKLFTDGKQSLPQESKQSLPKAVNKVDPIIITNKNTINNTYSIKPEEKIKGFNLAGQEREQNPITPHEKTLLTIEETKEKFLQDKGLFELFVRATKLERKNFDKAVDKFIEHVGKIKEYPRSYDRGNDDSKSHFKFWFVKVDSKEFEMVEPKPIIIPPTEEEKAEERRLSREKLDAYTATLKAKKEKMDEATALNRKTKENELRQLSKVSANVSAKGIPSYLLP